jgi:hypothetical protein
MGGGEREHAGYGMGHAGTRAAADGGLAGVKEVTGNTRRPNRRQEGRQRRRI